MAMMSKGDVDEGTDDLLPTARRGCGWCEIELAAEYRYLDTLSYENVNDVQVRDRLRAAHGLCNHHAWRFVDVARDSLGLAIIYRDILGSLTGTLEELVALERRPPLSGLLQRAVRVRDFVPGQIPRRLRPRAVCPACAAVDTALAERGYIGGTLCRPHLIQASGRMSGRELEQRWAEILRRLRQYAPTSRDATTCRCIAYQPQSRGTMLDLIQAVFGRRGIRPPSRRAVPPTALLEPSADVIERLAAQSDGTNCAICSLIGRDLLAILTDGSSAFPDLLAVLLRERFLCPSHAWLALDTVGGETEARRYLLSASMIEALAQTGGPSAGLCPACETRSQREITYCRGLAWLIMRDDAPVFQPAAPPIIICLPHLRLLADLAPAAIVTAISRSLIPVFQTLHQELTAYIRKEDYRFRHEPAGPEQTAPLRALALVAGSRWLG